MTNPMASEPRLALRLGGTTQAQERAFADSGLWSNRPLFAHVDEWAASTPNQHAVSDSRQSMTYAELRDASQVVALRLLSLGVEPGDTVAIQAPNSVLLPICHLAANRVQALYMPIHEAWREPEVAHLLERSGAKVVITVDRYKSFDHVRMVDGLRTRLPDLRHVLVSSWSAGREAELWSEPRPDPQSLDRLSRILSRPNRPRHAMISSGTTALPKISGWSDNGLHALLARSYVGAIELNATDVVVGIATASTGATGYVFGVLAPLYVGASSVLVEPWDPEIALRSIEESQGSVVVAVPAQLIKLLDSPTSRTANLDGLRAISNGGAPLPEDRARELEERFDSKVHTMYGTTDAGVPTMMRLTDPTSKRVTTVGRVVDGIELRVVDESGAPCEAGEPGEVQWRGAHKTHGYVNDDESTRSTFDAAGWYHSGDIGAIDDEGFLQIVGRSKDMILRGGQNIFPAEVEDVLSGHPAVSAVAVAPVPDDTLGERACAYVVPARGRAGLTLDAMKEFLSQTSLAKFKWPEHLVLLRELPTTAGGKVLKSALGAQTDMIDRSGPSSEGSGIDGRN